MKATHLPLFILFSALLSACGGSSSSGGSSGNSGANEEEGQVIDGPVFGLEYVGADGERSLTGPNGEFEFTGDSITFLLGGIELGSATDGGFVTPSTLAGDDDAARANIARFLQTLDNDGDPTNGINLTPRVREQAADMSISPEAFAVAPADFAGTEAGNFAQSANGDNRSLVDAETALAHLDSSERDIEDGHFDYDGGADTDGDGVNDAIDSCPESAPDTTVDGTGCAPGEAEADFDGDGVVNGEDNCPAAPNPDQSDIDGDGRGDVCDNDADGDGLINDQDPDPLSADTDGDGVIDGADNCPTIENASQDDLDGNGIGDACDDDRDGDGTPNSEDAFPDDPNEDTDTDGDGIGDNADAFPEDSNETQDSDGDGIGDNSDNCPQTANPDQADQDGDGIGDVCDDDRDGDGTPNDSDTFPDDPNEDADTDGDGVGDATDNCPQTANEDQADLDGDGVGDACDNDLDGDGVDNASDNCPQTANSDQADLDGDDVGDACDNDIDGDGTPNSDDDDNDNDGVDDVADFCPGTPLDTKKEDVKTENATNNGCTENQLAQGDYCSDGGIKLAGGNFHELQNSVNNLRSDGTPQTVSFQVFEPEEIDCATIDQGAHPLILHGHGFGGSRFEAKDNVQDYLSAGYAVISIDQRGFGDSSGTIRTMDPEAEGKDLIQILDWAEETLPYLAWKDDSSDTFIERPAAANVAATSVANGNNLVVGAIGGSYGAGYQFLILAVDDKNRLDALVPDIGWHDLRYSLNPGDTIKTGWDLLLVGAGEAFSYAPGVENGDSPTDRGLDPYIKETLARGTSTNEFPRDALKWFNYHSLGFWCANQGLPTMPYQVIDWGDDDPNAMQTPDEAVPSPGDEERTLPPVDVLLTQGFRDMLFNFNDGWWNYQCLSQLGGDVRLLTHQSGHILPGVQGASGTQACGGQALNATGSQVSSTVLAWFEEKLKGLPADTGSDEICLSLSDGAEGEDGDAVLLAAEDLLAPLGNTTDYTRVHFKSAEVPNGELAVALQAGGNNPVVVELGTIDAEHGAILAGIPRFSATVSGPLGTNEAACDPIPTIPTFRTGCDSIIFVGIGHQAAGESGWTLVDEQLYPVRGLGSHDADLNGIAERIGTGDKLALLVYGFHPQFPVSYSRDTTIQTVTVKGDVDLPLYAATADGTPDLDATADLAACGFPEEPHPDENVTQNGEEQLLPSIPTSTRFEVLDRDRDGCVQGYSTENGATIDVVRTDEDERDDRSDRRTIFNLDVPNWVSDVTCDPSPDECGQFRNLVEVGNFDNASDDDNELRVNTPSSIGVSESGPSFSSIHAVKWNPNLTAPAVGFSFSLEGDFGPQPLMRVVFDATDTGTTLACNTPDDWGDCASGVSIQSGDIVKAVFWHQSGIPANEYTIDFSESGLHVVHLYLQRGGGEFKRFAIHQCDATTSLNTFDPTDGSCSGGENGGWLMNFVHEWTVTEVAFDKGGLDTTQPKSMVLDDVELILTE